VFKIVNPLLQCSLCLTEITGKFHIMKQLTRKRKLTLKKTAISRLSMAAVIKNATIPTGGGGYSSGIPSCAMGWQ
jgi:tmRNA-binding protein